MSTMPTQFYGLMLADPWTLDDYTDITPFVPTWDGTVRGRQHELQLFQAGQTSLRLTNLGGWFNTWDTTGPFYNLLAPGDASAETADGTVNTAPVVSNWLAGTTSNLGILVGTPPVIIDGPTAYAVGVVASPATVTMPDNYYAVTAGKSYSFMCSFLAGTGASGRSCSIIAKWYTSGGAHIGGSDVTVTVTDNTSTWTKASQIGTVAPATAAFVAFQYSITGAATEEHWFSRVGLFNYNPQCVNTAWGPGQRGLVPGRTIQATATWSAVDYPIWTMYVSNWTPAYGATGGSPNFTTISCTDGMGLLALSDLSSSAYANQVLADGATSFWRLGDAPGSGQALDSGPNNSPLVASLVTFGQTSPILTDDTTVGAFKSSNLQGQAAQAPAAGAQTLEIDFMIPSGQKTVNSLFYSSNGSTINFNPVLSRMEGICAGGSGGPTDFYITNKIIANGAWHHLVVACSAATNGTIAVFLDGVLIGDTIVTGGDSSCLFDTSSAFWFGTNSSGANPLSGQMADIAVYGGTYLTGTQARTHYALFSAGFTVQYSGDRIAEMLTVLGWPASLQSLDTGVQMVQGATSSLTQTAALSYLQTVEQTEGPAAALFCDPSGILTFYDRWYTLQSTNSTVSNGTFSSDLADGGAYRYESNPQIVPLSDDLDLWNDIPVQRIGGVLQRVQSTLSMKQYRPRTLVGFTGQLQTDDSDVLAQGQWLLEQYDQPLTRVRSITLTNIADGGANLPQMLGRQIFDLITVRWRPVGSDGDYFEQPSLIESITHHVEQGLWKTTWMLTPNEISQTYLILNDANLGQLSAGNQLGY